MGSIVLLQRVSVGMVKELFDVAKMSDDWSRCFLVFCFVYITNSLLLINSLIATALFLFFAGAQYVVWDRLASVRTVWNAFRAPKSGFGFLCVVNQCFLGPQKVIFSASVRKDLGRCPAGEK